MCGNSDGVRRLLSVRRHRLLIKSYFSNRSQRWDFFDYGCLLGNVPFVLYFRSVRKGYTFAGWATERGGEVKLGVTEMIGNDGKTTFKVCLTRDDVKQISDGTTLYAVWSPDAT